MRKRKPLTRAQVNKLYERQGGKCACGCGAELVIGPKGQHVNFTDEHVQARGRGGSEALKNRQLWFNDCASKKTHHPRSKATGLGGDLFEIRKADNIREKARHKVVKRRKAKTRKHRWVSRPLRSRGFQGRPI